MWVKGDVTPGDDPQLLVQRAVEGDAESFGRLYELYIDQVYRHVYYRVSNSSDAEDITAQVFLNAWRAMPRYRYMGKPFQVWLLSIAHNLVVDYYRAQKSQSSIDDVVIASGESTDPVLAAERNFASAEVRQAIMKLKREQQQVIVLRFIDGLEYPDIAAIMGKREGAVRVILHRGLTALRGVLRSERRAE